MLQLIERYKLSALDLRSALCDRFKIAGLGLFLELQDQRASGAVLHFLWQLAQLFNSLFEQFGHTKSLPNKDRAS